MRIHAVPQNKLWYVPQFKCEVKKTHLVHHQKREFDAQIRQIDAAALNYVFCELCTIT